MTASLEMPRLGLANMTFGFAIMFLAASAGPFLATELTSGYLRDKALLGTWMSTLQTSAHGHTTLFALLHVALGLTLPYSSFSTRMKTAQSIGLGLGTIAMGTVMLVRAVLGPVDGVDLTEVVMGVMLSCALAAIGTHAAGLGAKLMRRG